MHATRRWVHSGLILSVVVISMSLTVLVLGATRGVQTNYGLEGAVAPNFYLRDSDNRPVTLGDQSKVATVLIFGGHGEGIASQTEMINKLVSVYSQETDIQFLGIAKTSTLSILGPGESHRSIMQEKCPELRVAVDTEGTVSRDYRVNGKPVLIIIDKNHIIQKRTVLDKDSVEITPYLETIQSLRPVTPNVTGLGETPMEIRPAETTPVSMPQ